MKEDRAVPDSSPPEHAQGEITPPAAPPDVPPELQAEFDAWDRASANALDRVERLALGEMADGQR